MACVRAPAAPPTEVGELARTISGTSRVVAARGQVSCDLGGEAAILSLESGVYYGLDPVGARVWGLVREPKTVAEVRDALVAEYDVEPDACERDLLALLRDLTGAGLIEVRNEPAP